MLGKIEGRRRRGCQRMRWLDSISNSVDMNLSKLWEMVKVREARCAVVPGGSQRAGHDLATEWHILLYDAVLVSAAQQSESAIHIHTAPLFSSHLDHHRALGRVPCAIGNTRLSLVIYFRYVSILYVCQSQSPSLSHLLPEGPSNGRGKDPVLEFP